MGKVYRTLFHEVPEQERRSISYMMPELLEPLLPKPKGALQAGLLWTGGLSDYQVVLMDINLPGMSGIECAARLKSLEPAMQIVMVTVYEDNDQIFKALRAGATGYLLKQTPPDELLNAIQEVHRGGSPMTGSIARKIVQSFHQTGGLNRPPGNLSPRDRRF
ncbi:MAG: response regulator transcription factor [Candidatus Omnitrophica bacterium]|nr:response regulator transcription factor [Candidatus Omnitrophota bacterium]